MSLLDLRDVCMLHCLNLSDWLFCSIKGRKFTYCSGVGYTCVNKPSCSWLLGQRPSQTTVVAQTVTCTCVYAWLYWL